MHKLPLGFIGTDGRRFSRSGGGAVNWHQLSTLVGTISGIIIIPPLVFHPLSTFLTQGMHQLKDLFSRTKKTV